MFSVKSINYEPARLAGGIRGLLLILAIFGFELTAEQTGAVMIIAELFLTKAVRDRVMPVVKVNEVVNQAESNVRSFYSSRGM